MLFVFAADKLVAATYADVLKAFDPVSFTDPDDVLHQIKDAKVIVIDADIRLARQIQKKAPNVSMIMITDTPDDFEQTDYTVLKKPVSVHVLRSKILFLKTVAEKGLTLSFGTPAYQFDGPARTLLVKKQNAEIRLTEKEAEIIQYLYENKDRLVPKDELLEKIFGYRAGVETHTVETHIYKLRQKVDDEDESLIATMDGGYQLKTT